MMGAENLDTVTPLYADMHICTEYLHCSHQEFLELPALERKKLRLFMMVAAKKKQQEMERLKLKQEQTKQQLEAPRLMRR